MADVDERAVSHITTLRKMYYPKDAVFHTIENDCLEMIGPDHYFRIAKVLEALQELRVHGDRDYIELLSYTANLCREEGNFENFLNLKETDRTILVKNWNRTLHTDFATFFTVLKKLNNPTIVILNKAHYQDPRRQLTNVSEVVKEVNPGLSLEDERLESEGNDMFPDSFYSLCEQFATESQNILDFCALTILILLSKFYGERVIAEIVVRARTASIFLTVADVLRFAENWEELKKYPIHWILQLDD